MILGSDGFAYKLFPQRIEEYFESLPDIESCGVVVKDDADRLHTAHAFITLKDVANSDSYLEDLKKHVSENLPEHLYPTTISILEKMPVTPSGKIDYRSLEENL